MASDSSQDRDYYGRRLRDGQQYEDFVQDYLAREHRLVIGNHASQLAQRLHGENLLNMQIKLDGQRQKTGHLWIEVAERIPPSSLWTPSELRAGRCWLFWIGDYDHAWLFLAKALRDAIAELPVVSNERDTSRGARLPIAQASKAAERVFALPGRESYYPTRDPGDEGEWS